MNGLTHLAGGVLALAGLILLLVVAGNASQTVALGVYGLSLVALYAASALYHLLPVSEAVVARLRRVDHMMIFVLIAGTYTPVCLLALTGGWRWGLLAVIWTLALAGIVLKLRPSGMMGSYRWLSVALYLGMGWLSLAALPATIAALPAGGMLWIVAGGGVYSLGAVVYATRRPNPLPGTFGFHEIWHLFVMVGSACHFWAIFQYVVPLA